MPYIIVPNLIEQTTWGGNYICQKKNVPYQKLACNIIGQSYELYDESLLSDNLTTLENPILELGQSLDPTNTIKFGQGRTFSINELINSHPLKVLGEIPYQKHGKKIQILCKFTQAKSNSYQLHVQKSSCNYLWQPKPESWYFFEPGFISLGIQKTTNWKEYEKICHMINQKMLSLSKSVKNGSSSLIDAEKEIKRYISKYNPAKFVNRICVKRHDVVDLSKGGIHHSWEENENYAPNGNILYEVQKNVYDENSTLRSFDQGKFKTDGSVRNLTIEDYFRFIDRSAYSNDPKSWISKLKIIRKSEDFQISNIFKTTNYQTQQFRFDKNISNEFTQTIKSYNHIFVLQGSINLITDKSILTISSGYSAFIPADTGKYKLESVSQKQIILLKTFVPG